MVLLMEASERLHIDYVKEGYRASNKKDYIKNMTVWLGWQEAVGCFQAYLDHAAKQANTCSQNSHQLDFNLDEDDNNDLNNPTVLVSSSTQTSQSVSVKPAYPHIGLSTITMDFKATGFLPALTSGKVRIYLLQLICA